MSIEMNDNLRRAMHRPPALRQPTKPEPALMKEPDCLLNRTETPASAPEPVQTGQHSRNEPESEIEAALREPLSQNLGNYENHDHRPASSPQPKRPVCHEPLGQDEGKTANFQRLFVRVVSYRRRLIDPDNLCPKYFIDLCRYHGFIPDDSAKEIDLSVIQEPVKEKSEERTEVEITYP